MLLVCPSCVSAYQLTASCVDPVPGAARCAHCHRMFPLQAASRVVSQGASSGVLPSPDLPRAALPPAIILDEIRPAQRRPPVRRPESRASRSPALMGFAVLAAVGVAMGCIAARERIATALPRVAPLFAALGLPIGTGLSLQNVQTALADEGSTRVLTLEGRIANDRSETIAVPNLRIVVRDGSAQSLYSWTTPSPQANLAPGEAVPFRSRLVAPPEGGHDIVVSFAESTPDQRVAAVGIGP